MRPALFAAALSLLMSLPAQAYEVETGPVMLCDTQQQAERFVQHFAGNQEAAIGAVNAEEHNPRACAIVEVAYVQGEPLGRSLLVLDTADDSAERLYVRAGWQRVGAVPDYAMWPQGGFCDTVFFWKRI